MSLVSTLAKVALGVALAKGVSHMAKNGMPGAAGAGGTAGRGTRIDQGAAPGGLGDMMGDLLGGGQNRSTSRSQQSGGMAGGLGGLLEQLAGKPAPTTRRTAPKTAPTSAQGGLGDLLGGLLGGGALGGAIGGGAGGLGNLLQDAMGGNDTAPASREQELAAAVMLKAMIQAAKADGKLDATEKQNLMQHLNDATQDELNFVNAELSAPVDLDGLVADIPQGMETQAYLISLMAIDLDSAPEAQYLHELAQALGLTQDVVNDIHTQAGAQPLYS